VKGEYDLIPANTARLGAKDRLVAKARNIFAGYCMRDVRFGWLLLAPMVVWMGLLTVYPLILALKTSFTNYHLLFPDNNRFVGLSNYWEAFADSTAQLSFRSTLIYAGIWNILVIGLSIAIALLMNEKFKGRPVARSLLLVPWAIPTVVGGLMWKWILHPVYGALNGVLYYLGLIEIDSKLNFTSSPELAMFSIILAGVWKAIPFVSLILLAGLQGIPEELYDAAKVDGCGRWRRFQHVTLPYLRPSLLVALVLGAEAGILVFDLIYVMTGGGPGGSTDMIAHFVYRMAFKAMRMGYASALAYILGIFLAIITAIYYKLLHTEDLM
jgi:ABC-type sugar transport system permease subunit